MRSAPRCCDASPAGSSRRAAGSGERRQFGGCRAPMVHRRRRRRMSIRLRPALPRDRWHPARRRPRRGLGQSEIRRAGVLREGGARWYRCRPFRLPSRPSMNLLGILPRPHGATIAYHRLAGAAPGIVFLGGFRSDMTGTKALFLEDYCRRRGQAFVRFDYFGHGASSGDFAHGTIGRWAEDAIAVVDSLTAGPQVLIGSSLGGWIMLLAAQARPARVDALIGIAAAPDFTADLFWARL